MVALQSKKIRRTARVKRTRQPWKLVVVIISMLGMAGLVKGIWQMVAQAQAPYTNKLAFGARAKIAGTEAISIQSAGSCKYKTGNDIMVLRRNALAGYPDLLDCKYEPDPRILGSDLSWLGNSHDSGKRAELLSNADIILNPFELLHMDMFMIAGSHNGNSVNNVVGPDARVNVHITNLQVDPRHMQIESTYDLSGYLSKANPSYHLMSGDDHLTLVRLIDINARDFGYKYLSVVRDKSFNIENEHWPGVYAMHCSLGENIHTVFASYKPVRPNWEYFTISEVPADIYISLWRDKPRSAYDVSDLTYVIHIK